MRFVSVVLAVVFAAHAAAAAPGDERVCEDPNAKTTVRLAACTRLIDAKPSAHAYWNRARAYFDAAVAKGNEKHYDEYLKQTAADFDRAIALEPNNADAYLARAMFRFTGPEPRQALADFDRAIALAPTATNYETRARIRENFGALKEALDDYSRALAIEPSSGGTLVNRAKVRV